MLERLAALFAGLDRAHGVYVLAKKQAEGEKVKGRALTEAKPVTLEVWRAHVEGTQGLGIVPLMDDGNVWWACIDIDTYPLDLIALEAKLNQLKLPLVVIRSKSGGAHLVLFLAAPTSARFVRAKLQEWAILIGYPGVEIFPKQTEHRGTGDIGNWLNMPYFGGDGSPRHAIFNGAPLSLADFLDFAEGRRVTKDALEKFLVGGDEAFNDAPPCLQHLIKTGFPRGTRNKGLFNLGVFSRFAFGDDWQQKVDDMNRRYMDPPLSSGEVTTTVKSLGRKNYFYSCSQDPIVSVCNKDICRTRKYGIGEASAASPPVMIGGITKINSDPPVYVVEVEAVQIECTAQDILEQHRFRKLVFERANKVVPLLKGPQWDAMLNEKMATMEVVAAPEDSGPEGQFRMHLENFCTSRVTANTLDEILLGKPFINVDDGRTYFRSTDLIRYLEQQHFREFNERKIWAVLKRMDCKHRQFSMKGKCVTVWAIPSFKDQSEPFATPPIDGTEL
jgi:hypothetical protein